MSEIQTGVKVFVSVNEDATLHVANTGTEAGLGGKI